MQILWRIHRCIILRVLLKFSIFLIWNFVFTWEAPFCAICERSPKRPSSVFSENWLISFKVPTVVIESPLWCPHYLNTLCKIRHFSVIFLGIFLSQAFQSFSTILTIFPIFAKGIIIYRELKMKKKLSFLKYTDYPNKVLFCILLQKSKNEYGKSKRVDFAKMRQKFRCKIQWSC